MIQLEGIHQTYQSAHGPVEALRGIDLEVAAGEVFGIIGRSGAGKSSLVRTINLLNRPSAGRVWVGGQELTALPDAALRAARRSIGMVFQHFNLLASRTVYDNVALPLEIAGMDRAAIRTRVLPLLDLVGLSGLRDRYPAQISGGQKQRVGIARALASRPGVLLSDEATSALDPETTRSILALLQRINRELGLTIVLITHQMQVIRQVAQRVAVIDAGRIVEQGAVTEVFTRPQHATTRSLLDEIVPQALPPSVLERLRQQIAAAPAGHAQALRVAFSGAGLADGPLLADLARRHAVGVAIVHGQIDEIQGTPYGALTLLLRGAPAALADAAAALQAVGVAVEPVDPQAATVGEQDHA
ncbi:methionine ABC transporter ATP-binding protein [uncultured Xylophilus sp.]|uniref:methionine ABC transporter ATP-binding protein n=1 Tax=uncultured Xylophilus sp. TaxID=296832 RepID=UPI0025D7F0B5|nr:methionine ABC transporter ATP-binding protein [uncultured Xylophilus sp.]